MKFLNYFFVLFVTLCSLKTTQGTCEMLTYKQVDLGLQESDQRAVAVNDDGYKVSLLNINISLEQCSVVAINDKGQLLGSYTENDKNKVYILDAKNECTFIESKDQSIYPSEINNAGQVLGYGSKPFIWSKALGIRYLDVFNSQNVSPKDLNDLGQIIGIYEPVESNRGSWRPFLWDYGVVTDMGPGSEFSNAIEVLGYHVMNIQLISINNKGELAGYFSYAKFNEMKKKYVVAGYKTFFWNGDVNILPLPNDTQPGCVQLNNHGVILVNDSDQFDHISYLWDIENNLRPIADFSGITLNDSLTILGDKRIKSTKYSEGYVGVPAIWKNNQIYTIAELLGVLDINAMAPYLSDSYGLEKIKGFYRINNKGQIPCMGWIWGDQYPCLLEPVKKLESPNDPLKTFIGSYNRNTGNDSWTLLHHAANLGQAEVCQLLIEQGQDPNCTDKYGQTPLILATFLNRNAQTSEEKKTL